MRNRISKEEAQALAIIAQGLDEPIRKSVTKTKLIEMIRRIGCLQIDTISVVARSHYLVLWSRVGQYDPALLDELHHPDRSLFEYWGHAASLIPTELFPYFRRKMLARKSKYFETPDPWTSENQALIHDVLDAVRQHGPLSSSHFERPDSTEPVEAWSWWGGKPANRALDILWSTGALSIQRRVNFQRHFDLVERVFPEHADVPLPEESNEQRTLATRALQAMGIGLPAGINDYFRTKWGTKTRSILADLERDSVIFGIEIDDLGKAYVAESSRSVLKDVIEGRRPRRTTLLSPFDNLIWERRRTESLFGFEYRLECYTPAAKRKFGYFTLPILDQGKLIGRLDPKVDRREGVLYVRSIHLEEDACFDTKTAQRLTSTLRDFASFNGAASIVVESGPPEIEHGFDA